MKAVRILSLILFLVAFYQARCFAQNDYFVTTRNDTVYCQIKDGHYRSFVSKGLMQYKNSTGKTYQVRLDTVQAFFVAGDTAIYVLKYLPVSNSRVYLRWLEKGKINLYEELAYANNYSEENKYWFISKGTESLVQIKTNGTYGNIGSRKDRVKAFLNAVSDCPNVTTELKYTDLDKNYDFDVVRGFIKMYNEHCAGQ
jgi:hypothetical protein